MMKLRLRSVCTALLAGCLGFGLAGCGKKTESHSPDAPAHAGEHHHRAPHGGTLVEVGEHQFNLEFVRDEKAGTLTAYVLDAHAENFVRLPLPALSIVAQVGGRPETLLLAAVANQATGETVGNTSQFTGAAAWLKTADHFDATVSGLEIRGTKFADVKFHLHDDDHHGH